MFSLNEIPFHGMFVFFMHAIMRIFNLDIFFAKQFISFNFEAIFFKDSVV